MSTNPIRLAVAALSGRIFAGRPTKDGLGFKEPRYDVTSDVLRCVSEHVGIGNEVTVHCDGKPAFRIAVYPAQGMAAQSGKTEGLDRNGNSPAPQGDAPPFTPGIQPPKTQDGG